MICPIFMPAYTRSGRMGESIKVHCPWKPMSPIGAVISTNRPRRPTEERPKSRGTKMSEPTSSTVWPRYSSPGCRTYPSSPIRIERVGLVWWASITLAAYVSKVGPRRTL